MVICVRGEDAYLVLLSFFDLQLFSPLQLMATLGASGSSNTSPRWGRTGEPGSAFSGLSRARGRGRGIRGGRGRAREGLSEVDIPSTEFNNSQSSSSPSTKSSTSPFISTPTSGNSNLPPSSSSKPKSAPRRGSRTMHVTAAPQINESVVTASVSAAPAKVTHKRRRSQAGKPVYHVPPKANAPTLTDTPLRSNKIHHESHTDSLKHIPPPHINGKFDVRNDIDALVERVRAVAMDNRPSTPKSHIDWAVDDDDTLPDLDDWGVTTSSLTTQLDGISPIIVDGLRSLPEFAANSTVSSPLKQVEAVKVQPIMDVQSIFVNGIAPDAVPPYPRSTREEDIESNVSPQSRAKCDPHTAVPLDSNSLQPNAGLFLRPSLPLSVDSIVQHTNELRPIASPVGFVSQPTSPITPIIDLSGMPGRYLANSKQTDAQESVEVAFEANDYKVLKAATWTPESRLKDPEHLIVVEPITESLSPNTEPGYTQTAQEPSPSGLRASMHAPKSIVDSVSTPANLSTLADSRTHDPIHTHTRAHTVGRSPLPNSTIREQGDYISRATRSGYTTPKGGFQGTSHSRTRSTPPGDANHYRSPHTSRPVITGDAISRLARTIGKTHNDQSVTPEP